VAVGVVAVQLALYAPLFCILPYQLLHAVSYVHTLFTTLRLQLAFVVAQAVHICHCAVYVLFPVLHFSILEIAGDQLLNVYQLLVVVLQLGVNVFVSIV